MCRYTIVYYCVLMGMDLFGHGRAWACSGMGVFGHGPVQVYLVAWQSHADTVSDNLICSPTRALHTPHTPLTHPSHTSHALRSETTCYMSRVRHMVMYKLYAWPQLTRYGQRVS